MSKQKIVDETWCIMQTKTISFSFRWTIRNYSCQCHIKECGDDLTSPIFTAEQEPYKTRWYLAIYPKGRTRDCADYLSFQLIPILQKDETVTAKYTFSILNEKGEKTNTSKSEKWLQFGRNLTNVGVDGWVGSKTLCDTLVKDDILKLFCEISMIDETTTTEGCRSNIKVPLPVIGENFASLLKTQLLSDVTLIAGGEKFKVHKCILAARSSVFAAMFTHEMEENNTNIVEISDVDRDVLREVLKYIYTGTANWGENALDILIAADKYALERLKIKCAEFLGSDVETENVAEILSLADLYRSPQLKARALDFIRRNSVDVLKTAGWNKLADNYPKLMNDVTLFLSQYVIRE